jgi:hypothetical protein
MLRGRARFPFSGRQPGKINEICLWCTSFLLLSTRSGWFLFQIPDVCKLSFGQIHFFFRNICVSTHIYKKPDTASNQTQSIFYD